MFDHWNARALRRGAAGLALLATAASAPAAVIESLTVSTTYGYGFTGPSTTMEDGEPDLSIRNGGNVAGIPSEFGMDYTTTADADSFFFLHNQYCVGRCVVSTVTQVAITLRNYGDSEPMRFDSQITAGHLARLGLNDASTASFNFKVTQTTDGVDHELYSATGLANSTGTNITTSNGLGFNGLTRYSNGDAWEVVDWSATNLNLLLDSIPLNGTSTLIYTSQTYVNAGFSAGASACTDLSNCYGVQVAFGDPRDKGSTSENLTAFGRSVDALANDPLAPVIGRLYDASKIKVDVVAASADLPPQPGVLPAVTYGAPFVSQLTAVPEPTSWMMMIAGFGMVGSRCRRRAASAFAV